MPFRHSPEEDEGEENVEEGRDREVAPTEEVYFHRDRLLFV